MFDSGFNSPLQQLNIFKKRFILDVWQGSKYASAIHAPISIRRLSIAIFKFLIKKSSDISDSFALLGTNKVYTYVVIILTPNLISEYITFML